MGMSETERRLIAALEDALDGMEGMIGYVPEYFQEKWDLPPYIDRAKAVLAEFREGDDDPEGGVREPAGDSPDSPPAGESRLPGPGDCVITDDASADYAGGTWPVLPAGLKVSTVFAGRIG